MAGQARRTSWSTTGTKCQHISNNAPTNLAGRRRGAAQGGRRDREDVARGLRGARREVDAHELAAGARPEHPAERHSATSGDGYPRNLDIIPLLDAAIESYKEMADYGGNLGIKVTFENHWGLAADPMNIRIMLDDDQSSRIARRRRTSATGSTSTCSFNGLKALAPYSHTNVHAKYWDRWGDKNDVQRSTRIMLAGGFKGTFALEYEAGPLNGIEGAKYLYKEVLAALSSPTPVI